MWMLLERSIFRVNRQFLRFYTVHLENTKSSENISEFPYDKQIVISQSWNIINIRSDDTKSLKIAILGLPNVGKSTLVNQLVGCPVCAASSKVQTTRKKCDAIYVEDDTQLIFIDTPGLVTNRDFHKFKLDNHFKTDVDEALKKTDVVGVVQDASHPFKSAIIDERILAVLNRMQNNIPSVLILNKIDKVKKKDKLLGIVDALTGEKGWSNFSDIFMISALTSDGIDDLRKYFIESAKKRDWEYSRDAISNEPPERIIQDAVRAKFMDFAPQEMPYLLKVETEHMSTLPDGSISTVVSISCPSDRISKLIMGKGGGRVKTVAVLAEQELSQVFKTSVRLKIAVKFSKTKDEIEKESKNKNKQ